MLYGVYYFMDINLINHLHALQKISNTFPFIDVNGYRGRFNCAMHFLTEQNFSAKCNIYTSSTD